MGRLEADGGAVRLGRARRVHGWARGPGLHRPRRAAPGPAHRARGRGRLGGGRPRDLGPRPVGGFAPDPRGRRAVDYPARRPRLAGDRQALDLEVLRLRARRRRGVAEDLLERRPEVAVPKTLEVLFGLPDVVDVPAALRRAGAVHDQPLWEPVLCHRRLAEKLLVHRLVLLLGRALQHLQHPHRHRVPSLLRVPAWWRILRGLALGLAKLLFGAVEFEAGPVRVAFRGAKTLLCLPDLGPRAFETLPIRLWLWRRSGLSLPLRYCLRHGCEQVEARGFEIAGESPEREQLAALVRHGGRLQRGHDPVEGRAALTPRVGEDPPSRPAELAQRFALDPPRLVEAARIFAC